MSRHIASWLTVIAAIAGISGGLAYYKLRETAAANAAASAMYEPAMAVASSRARAGAWSMTTKAIGTVVALRMLELRNESAGKIVKVGFTSGDIVEQGQVLVAFDARAEQAALAAAEAEAHLAELTLARRAKLRKSQAFSEQDFDKARFELATFKARAEALAVVVDKKTIKAPFRARIGITSLQPGTYLDSGTLIATLQGVDDEAYIDFALPQDNAALVRAGSKVVVRSPAIEGGFAEAVIEAESEGVDPVRRTVGFRARVKGLGERLRPGMFVDVSVVTSEPVATVFVPLTAVRRSTHGEHVFVLSEAEGRLRAHYRVVQTGPTQGSDIAIDSGLQAGERVATDGSFKLNDGMLVQSDGPAADAAQSGTN
jgi:membrane fusion protein (multidrug efflux system)